jgi:hypothetical protein
MIMGGIGVVWGGAILLYGITIRSGPIGTTVNIGVNLFGLALFLVGGFYLFAELYYKVRDSDWYQSLGRRRRRRDEPQSKRSRDPRREAPRSGREERQPRPARRDNNNLVIPLVIGVASVAIVLFIGGLFAVIWLVRPSPSAGGSNRAQSLTTPAGSKDNRALAADLTGDHFTARAAMDALIARGPKAEPEVIPYLNHDDFNARHRSAQVIEKIGTSASLAELQRVIASGRSVGGTCENAVVAIKAREQSPDSRSRPKQGDVARQPEPGRDGAAPGAGQRPDTPPRRSPPPESIFAFGPRVFLADLSEFDVKPGAWPFRKDGTTGDDKNSPITVGGERSPHGLGMHPPFGRDAAASVKYRLGKQAARFKAVAAIDDSGEVRLPVTFTVLGDGKVLLSGGYRLRESDKHPREISVDVSGVEVLELRVACEFSNHRVHAVWVEPRLLQRADTPDK